MLGHLAELYRFRALIATLVLRDLRARYRGSFLGFLWSFLNPLLLMLVYALVFAVYLRVPMDNYAVFLFSGLLPWLWFSSSLGHAAGVIVGSGGLVKRIMFPAEILPLVSVLSNLVNLLLSLPLLFVFLWFSGIRPGPMLAVPAAPARPPAPPDHRARAAAGGAERAPPRRRADPGQRPGPPLLPLADPLPGHHGADDAPPDRRAGRAAPAPLLPQPGGRARPELPEHHLLRERAPLDPPRGRDRLRGSRCRRTGSSTGCGTAWRRRSEAGADRRRPQRRRHRDLPPRRVEAVPPPPRAAGLHGEGPLRSRRGGGPGSSPAKSSGRFAT